MKKKNKHAQLKRRKEFRFHDVELTTPNGKKKNIAHPAYVFLQHGNVYIYAIITHSNNVQNRVLIKLKKNPNPEDQRDVYVVDEIKQDTKDRFGKKRIGWELDPDDDLLIRSLYKKR